MFLLPYKTNPNKTKRKNATRDYPPPLLPRLLIWRTGFKAPRQTTSCDVKAKDASEKKKKKTSK